MEGSPSRKRARKDHAHNAQSVSDKLEAATRDKEYWLEDGNLILLSQGYAFRIYRGLLAEHSSVFCNMFQSATPAPDEVVDGCPVVVLDDSPLDLRELFRLIHPLSSALRKDGLRPPVTMSFIWAIIRLDYKYELGMREQAMDYLTSYYTTSFDAWTDSTRVTDWQPRPIDAISAVNIARFTNTDSILPSAFYVCASMGPDLARGVVREDESVERLSPEDMTLCLQMKEHLATADARAFLDLFQLSNGICAPICCDGEDCGLTWLGVVDYSTTPGAPHVLGSSLALVSWVENLNALNRNGGGWTTCLPCLKNFKDHDRELRQGIWRKLPEMVGMEIQNWDKPNA